MRAYVLLVTAGLLAFSTTLRAAEPRVFPDVAARFPVGDPGAHNPISENEGPKTLAAGDVDGDGLADVVAGNLDGSISVLLGRTNNTIAAQVLTPATGLLSNSSLRSVVLADFNGDGKLDVAAGDIAREGVVVLLGNGDGTLYPFSRTALGPVRAMAAGDFNQDNKVDLVVACSPPNCEWCAPQEVTNAMTHFLCVLPGNGDGSFSGPQYLLTPGTQACFYDVDANDLDGDGHLDALALDFDYCWSTNGVTRSRRLRVFKNNGNGGFAVNAPTRTLETAGEGPRAFKVGYVDERFMGGVIPPGATKDIVVANRDSGTIDVFLNGGGIAFTNPLSIHTGGLPRDLGIGDLNGDGYIDLLVVDRNNDAIVALKGMGGGKFDEGIRFPTGVSPRNVVLADFNGDGALDAAVNNRLSEDISIFVGKHGVSGFLVPQNYYPAGVTPVSLVVEDFNGDGRPDMAVSSLRSHAVHVRLNIGNGLFGEETIYPVNFEPAILASGDLNGDGKRDLLVSCLGSSGNYTASVQGSLVTLLGNGNGTFQVAVSTTLGSVLRQPYWIKLGDVDDDGVLDAVVGGLSGELAAFRGRGDGTFDPGVAIAFHASGRPLGIALGDFDGDGRLDIATSRGIIVLNDGQFFANRTNFGAGYVSARIKNFNAGTQAWAVEADDLDGDGLMDLMVALTFVRPDPIGVYFGNGDGTLTAPTIYEGPDVGVVALAATDVDADGVKDIIVGNRCAATVIVMKGLGNRRFAYREIIKAYSVEDVAVADINGDGKPDILGVGWGAWASINGGTNRLVEAADTGAHVTPARSGLFINEIMALNTHYHVIGGSTPDWVEIFNNTAFTQNMAGWSLVQYTGDDAMNQWFFPATNTAVIPPRGHLVVYLKNKAGATPGLYASFELSSDGENLFLLRPGGTPEDAVQFPAMPEDVSFARFADGARFFAYNPAPTIGTANRRPANLQPSAERKDPYVGPGASSLGLNARFFDDVALAYVGVVFRVVGSNQWDEIVLNDDGQHGDKLNGDGYYGGILPSMPGGTQLEYYLRVVDLEGQSGTSPKDGEQSTKLHQVTVPTRAPSLRLTELVAANNTGLRDERSQVEDWVEIMNVSATPQSLDGYVLSRDYFDKLGGWRFPSNRILAPGERIIVFCDDDAGQGVFHANFKLLRTGDRIFLIKADSWTIVDSLSFGPLPMDTSFGVIGAGTDAGWLAWPTPYGENLPIPPRRYPETSTPEVFWRMGTNTIGGRMISMRWIASTNMLARVEWSSDLKTWQPAALFPTPLGEDLHQWSDSAVNERRFYRLRRVP